MQPIIYNLQLVPIILFYFINLMLSHLRASCFVAILTVTSLKLIEELSARLFPRSVWVLCKLKYFEKLSLGANESPRSEGRIYVGIVVRNN